MSSKKSNRLEVDDLNKISPVEKIEAKKMGDITKKKKSKRKGELNSKVKEKGESKFLNSKKPGQLSKQKAKKIAPSQRRSHILNSSTNHYTGLEVVDLANEEVEEIVDNIKKGKKGRKGMRKTKKIKPRKNKSSKKEKSGKLEY